MAISQRTAKSCLLPALLHDRRIQSFCALRLGIIGPETCKPAESFSGLHWIAGNPLVINGLWLELSWSVKAFWRQRSALAFSLLYTLAQPTRDSTAESNAG